MNALPSPSVPPSARVGRSFARNFQTYHANARLQAAIAKLLARRLQHHGAPSHFASGFEFGCGTGHLTGALRARFTFGELTLNDLVPEAAKVARAHGAAFHPGDIRRTPWPDRPTLIASASTLQWMRDPAALVARAADQLAPGGWLALSGFGPQQYRELSALGSAAGAPGLCHPETLASPLEGFRIHEARGRCHRLWFTSAQEVLRHLRATGVNGAARAVWTRARLRDFCDGYRARFEQDGQVSLTYHPVWLIAQKPAV
ncbi:methyltransferase domain-containing protein [Aliiroseovarius crassostreae]|uniref:methyltransferase domain-containing protein n=1 Tax=Aliiroseovarius crassostreae TaxID=154981 RepID=UPI0022000B3E|nr:methyltransferase domain-containing protein [Aliiroseovarius crassostreae]UWP90800.1 methyltransferase domain-containing protein [Aliiroseovarius crassostreae]UWQ03463.1 methyltransferase domain-containing protein [Aliiroseovarius crassostreae]